MDKGHTISVLDKGYCKYVDHLGTDLRIVETARVCYDSPSKGEYEDKKLLHYLYKNRHLSPFESCNITFNIRMPIFVMRQFVRHRVIRLNEISGRYVELKDEFYIPKSWRPQDNKNRQGSIEQDNWNPSISYTIDHERDDSYATIVETATEILEKSCRNSYQSYKKLLEAGIAKEMARFLLPVNLYTEIYANCDVRNLLHFFTLRLDAHAQWEIREYAKAMYQIFQELYPWTAEAYQKYSWELKENA